MDTCMLILALAEYFVMKFRGQAITLFDIVNIKTATTVAGSYNYDISLQVCIYILCFLFFIVLQLLFQKGEISENRKRRTVRYLLWSGYSLILVIVGINLKNIGIFSELNLWDISSDYNEKGYIYTLLAEGHFPISIFQKMQLNSVAFLSFCAILYEKGRNVAWDKRKSSSKS